MKSCRVPLQRGAEPGYHEDAGFGGHGDSLQKVVRTPGFPVWLQAAWTYWMDFCHVLVLYKLHSNVHCANMVKFGRHGDSLQKVVRSPGFPVWLPAVWTCWMDFLHVLVFYKLYIYGHCTIFKKKFNQLAKLRQMSWLGELWDKQIWT